MKKTGYDSKAEFNSDTAEHEQLDNNVIKQIRDKAINIPDKKKPEYTEKRAHVLSVLPSFQRQHDAADNGYKDSFNNAINAEGEVVNDFAKDNAVRKSEEAIQKLNAIKSIVAGAGFTNEAALVDAVDDELESEHDIHDKMKNTRNVDAKKKENEKAETEEFYVEPDPVDPDYNDDDAITYGKKVLSVIPGWKPSTAISDAASGGPYSVYNS